MGYQEEEWTHCALPGSANENATIAYSAASAVNGTAVPSGSGIFVEIWTTTDAFGCEVAAGGAATTAARFFPAYTRMVLPSKTGYWAFIRSTADGNAYVATAKKG
jgi:hypothetical protein